MVPVRATGPQLTGPSDPILYSLGFIRSQDTNIVAGTHLTGTTVVGWQPYALPPRTEVLRGFIGGTTTPTSAGNAGFQVQLFTLDELSFLPGTMIGATGSYNVVGSGALLDTSAPPYIGLQAGGNWWAAFTPPTGWRNESFHDPLLVSVGFQLQGSGAFTAGEFYAVPRNVLGPALLQVSATAWQYTFVNNPTLAGQASGSFAGRPMMPLQLARI